MYLKRLLSVRVSEAAEVEIGFAGDVGGGGGGSSQSGSSKSGGLKETSHCVLTT